MKPAAVLRLPASQRKEPNLLRLGSKLLVGVEHAVGVLNAILLGDDVHLSPGLHESSGAPQTAFVECGLKQASRMAALSEAIRVGEEDSPLRHPDHLTHHASGVGHV